MEGPMSTDCGICQNIREAIDAYAMAPSTIVQRALVGHVMLFRDNIPLEEHNPALFREAQNFIERHATESAWTFLEHALRHA